jgi:hypothetical protein
MHPPTYLHPGEVLHTTIQGIGQLRNPCVAEQPQKPDQPERPHQPERT